MWTAPKFKSLYWKKICLHHSHEDKSSYITHYSNTRRSFSALGGQLGPPCSELEKILYKSTKANKIMAIRGINFFLYRFYNYIACTGKELNSFGIQTIYYCLPLPLANHAMNPLNFLLGIISNKMQMLQIVESLSLLLYLDHPHFRFNCYCSPRSE